MHINKSNRQLQYWQQSNKHFHIFACWLHLWLWHTNDGALGRHALLQGFFSWQCHQCHQCQQQLTQCTFCSISLHYNHCYLCHSELNKLLKGGKRTCAVVVAQLTKRSLPIPEVHSSKSNIGKIFQYVRQLQVNRFIEKRVNKEKVTKRGGEHKSLAHDSTSLVHYGIVLQLKHDSKKVSQQKCSSGKSSKSS